MLIRNHVKQYVALKQRLGYKFEDQAQMLLKFASYADEHNDVFVLTHRLIKWASKAPSIQRSREWFRTGRNFAISMHGEDDRHEIPPRDVYGKAKRRRPAPYILTRSQIRKIMDAALKLPPIASITPYTYHYLLGLIAAAGLRVSEAVSLLTTDIIEDGLLIRETKFRKTRLVPIHSSTRDALKQYLTFRRKIGGSSSYLFVLSTGEPPDHASVSRAFIKLARLTGIRGPKGKGGPRLHDLRHSFVVRSLEECGNAEGSIQRHMLALSTYIGHACMNDTYWYLEATPILYRQIADVAEILHAGGPQ